MHGDSEIRDTGPSDPLGRRHQLRVDIAISISLLPGWVRRMIADRNPQKAREARSELVERVASAIERRFRVTWLGCEDDDPNARAPAGHDPLFGRPDRDGMEVATDRSENRIDSMGGSDGT